MRIAVTITRVLLGLLFVFSAVVVLFNLVPQPELSGKVKLFNEGIAATGYFMPMLKIIELICGIALVAGLYVPLATVVIFPITINIMMYHLFLAPEGAVVGVVMVLATLFLAWYYRLHYAPLLKAK